jgi:hypothetical protein
MRQTSAALRHEAPREKRAVCHPPEIITFQPATRPTSGGTLRALRICAEKEHRMEAAAQSMQWSKGYEGTSFEGVMPRLIEPEILLPSQFFDRFRGRSILEGERRLMLAVLEDGIMCYQKHASATRPRSKRLFQEAEQWIFEEGDAWPFSFESICGFFSLDPGCFRQRLNGWRQQLLAQSPDERVKVARVRLRAARRHKILPFVPRRRQKAAAA